MENILKSNGSLVTTEMEEAGAHILCDRYAQLDDSVTRAVAKEIYLSMLRARDDRDG